MCISLQKSDKVLSHYDFSEGKMSEITENCFARTNGKTCKNIVLVLLVLWPAWTQANW